MNAQTIEEVFVLRRGGASWREVERRTGVSATAARRASDPEGYKRFLADCIEYQRKRRSGELAPKQVHYRTQKRGAMRRVLAETAKHFGLLQREIIAQDHRPCVAIPRHIACYLMRVDLQVSYPSIGRLLDRDHSTVINSVKRVSCLLAAGDHICADVEAIRARLKAGRAG